MNDLVQQPSSLIGSQEAVKKLEEALEKTKDNTDLKKARTILSEDHYGLEEL